MPRGIVPAYTTPWGRAYHADALAVLRRQPDEGVRLVHDPADGDPHRWASGS